MYNKKDKNVKALGVLLYAYNKSIQVQFSVIFNVRRHNLYLSNFIGVFRRFWWQTVEFYNV